MVHGLLFHTRLLLGILGGIDNLTAPLYSLSLTWHTRATHAAPPERRALFPHNGILMWSCYDARSIGQSL
jgi:hypothetical protein